MRKLPALRDLSRRPGRTVGVVGVGLAGIAVAGFALPLPPTVDQRAGTDHGVEVATPRPGSGSPGSPSSQGSQGFPRPSGSSRFSDSPGEPGPSTAPNPAEVPNSASGVLLGVAVPAEATVGDGRLVRYIVEVERGLPVTGRGFADDVHAILTDPRGWQDVDGVAFERIPAAERGAADLIISLASADLTDELCAPLQTDGEVSCWNGQRAVINATRWLLGTETYGQDVEGYQRYLVSHEAGHGLGHGHVDCPAPGAPAPVMVQQTFSLQGCTPNPWPAGQ